MATKKVVAVLPKVHTVGTVCTLFHFFVALYAVYAIGVSMFSETLNHVQFVGELFFGLSLFFYALTGFIVSSDLAQLGLKPSVFFRLKSQPAKENTDEKKIHSIGIPVVPAIIFFFCTFFVTESMLVYILCFYGIFVAEYILLRLLFNHCKEYYKKFPELLC